MKEEIESVFSLIQDYKDGVGGVTDAFIMNELKCLVNEAQQQVNSVDLADVVPKVKVERHRLRDVDEEKYLSEMERLGFEFITFDTKIESSDQFRYYYFRHKQ